MPEPMTPAVAQLRGFLDDADITSTVLRRDPSGQSWLPAELLTLVAADDACRRELARFVTRELELFDSVRQRSDALFTARVLQAAAPQTIAGAGLNPRLRGYILALAYALATATAYYMLAPILGLAAVDTWTQHLGLTASDDHLGLRPFETLAILATLITIAVLATMIIHRRTHARSV